MVFSQSWPFWKKIIANTLLKPPTAKYNFDVYLLSNVKVRTVPADGFAKIRSYIISADMDA